MANGNKGKPVHYNVDVMSNVKGNLHGIIDLGLAIPECDKGLSIGTTYAFVVGFIDRRSAAVICLERTPPKAGPTTSAAPLR